MRTSAPSGGQAYTRKLATAGGEAHPENTDSRGRGAPCNEQQPQGERRAGVHSATSDSGGAGVHSATSDSGGADVHSATATAGGEAYSLQLATAMEFFYTCSMRDQFLLTSELNACILKTGWSGVCGGKTGCRGSAISLSRTLRGRHLIIRVPLAPLFPRPSPT